MKLSTYIKQNRRSIDAVITSRLGCQPSEIPHPRPDFSDPTPQAQRSDPERRLWVLNDEALYNAALRYGVDFNR